MSETTTEQGNKPKTHDTFVIGITDGKITFLKSYNYFAQKDEAQKDLSFVSDENNFTGWYISHVGSWTLVRTDDDEERLQISIPMPEFNNQKQSQ